MQGGKLAKVGINLDAPGDRRDTSGVLWVEYPFGPPVAGFTKPLGSSLSTTLIDSLPYEIPLKVTVAPIDTSMNYWRHHAARVMGDMTFVGASGVENAASVALNMIYDPKSGPATPVTTENYTVSLVFMEPNFQAQPGDRVFDVSVNGVPVLSNYDIIADAGRPYKSVVKTFHDISVTDMLTVTLTPRAGKPVLSGFSAIQQ